jgi:heme A synthase
VDLPDILKLVAAVLMILAGIWQYRRRAHDPENNSYGSQSGVLLLVVGAILLIVALGGLEYRPSPSEIEAGR